MRGLTLFNAILATKIARAVYFMLKHKTGFSPEMMMRGRR
jgi:hypothetical protein